MNYLIIYLLLNNRKEKNMKKLLLGLGAATSVIAPIATVVACGSTSDSSKAGKYQIPDNFLTDGKVMGTVKAIQALKKGDTLSWKGHKQTLFMDGTMFFPGDKYHNNKNKSSAGMTALASGFKLTGTEATTFAAFANINKKVIAPTTNKPAATAKDYKIADNFQSTSGSNSAGPIMSTVDDLNAAVKAGQTISWKGHKSNPITATQVTEFTKAQSTLNTSHIGSGGISNTSGTSSYIFKSNSFNLKINICRKNRICKIIGLIIIIHN